MQELRLVDRRHGDVLPGLWHAGRSGRGAVGSGAPACDAPAGLSRAGLSRATRARAGLPRAVRARGARRSESEARASEKTDPARAATLYRQAIVARLDSGEDLLTDRSLRRDIQRLFDRLSLALKRAGLPEEALEEIDTAAYLGLVDDAACGTKAQREALAKRRDALRRAVGSG